MVDSNENIYVEFDYQNVVLVDPNKVINSQGQVRERAVMNENLVCYANLECALTPRTRLALGIDNVLRKNLISVATINFLNPNKGKFLTDEYYDEITGLNTTKGQGANQIKETADSNPLGYVKQVTQNIDTGLLGITDISIETKNNGYFDVTINMEDYRGRALFEKGDESPYACFFTYPYPIFYLTVKGYFGKGVQHQLELTSFNASYSPESGNFKITTKYKTYQYSFLQRLPVQHLFALPYMYESKFTITPPSNVGEQSKNVQTIPVTRGLQKIKEVYQEYKSKDLIANDFPEITIQDFIVSLNNLERNLINAFTQEDLSPLTDYTNYVTDLEDYQKSVLTSRSSFFRKYMDITNFYIVAGAKNKIYTFKKEIRENKDDIKAVTELKSDIEKYNKLLNENKTFGKSGTNPISNTLSFEIINVTNPEIDYEETFKQRTGQTKEEDQTGFDRFKIDINQILNSLNTNTSQSNWFQFDELTNSFIKISESMLNEANAKGKKIEDDLQNKLSEFLQKKDNGLGFQPTIRNMIAVFMANSEAFLRILCDIHSAAWEKRNDPIRTGVVQDKSKTVTSPDLKDFVDINDQNLIPVYPWPHYFVETNDQNGEKYILQYPGDPKHISKTKAYLTEIWPEVEFVEEYIRAKAKVITSATTETFSDLTNTNQNVDRISLNSLDFPVTDRLFANKQEVRFLFEIWERVFVSSFYQRLGKDSATKIIPQIIAEVETINIVNSLGTDNPFLIQKLKQYDLNSANLIAYLANISNQGTGQSWQKYIRDIFVTNYIQTEVENDFVILTEESINPNNNKINPEPKQKTNLIDYLKSTTSNQFEFLDTFPFSISDWFKSNLSDGSKNTDFLNTFNTTKTLFLNEDKKLISNFDKTSTKTQIRPITNFNFYENKDLPEPTKDTFVGVNFKNFYENRIGVNLKNQLPTEGGVFYKTYNGSINQIQTTSILNTPYFTNAILEGVNKFTSGDKYPYVAAAYLFLNSLPLATLREKYKTFGNSQTLDLDYIFASIKKFGGIHRVPYAWILKYGSIWHRYKVWKKDGTDILSNSWKSFDAVKNFDPITNNPQKEYNLKVDGLDQTISLDKVTTILSDNIQEYNVGFYPKTINDFNIFCRGFGLFSDYTDTEIQSFLNATGDSFEIKFTDNSSFNKSKGYNPSNSNESLRFRTWSGVLYDKENNVRYITPSFGSNINQAEFECFNNKNKLKVNLKNNPSIFNGSVRLFWGMSNYGYFDSNQIDIPKPTSYMKSIFFNESQQESFSFNKSEDYTSIEEIFSVFDIKVLDKLEQEFLDYCRSMYDIQIINSGDTTISIIDITKLSDNAKVKFKNFQMMMVDMLKVEVALDPTSKTYVSQAQKTQYDKIFSVIRQFMEYDEIMKIGNPGGYNRLLFDSFSTVNFVEEPLTFNSYVAGSLPTNGGTTLLQSQSAYPETWKLLELYVGFSNISGLKYSDQGSYITDFFIDGNIVFNENSVKTLAPLIKIYATRKKNDTGYNWNKFVNDINNYLTKNQDFLDLTLNFVFNNLRNQLPNIAESKEEFIKKQAINSEVLPLSLWDSFKALNDRWIAGFDFNQKCLMEDVLILDRANRNIGDKHFFDVIKVKILNDFVTNQAVTVWGILSSLLDRHNFNVSMRSSYANFYGVTEVQKDPVPKIEGTLEFGNEIFGTFMNVDLRKTAPKMVCILRTIPGEHLDINKNKEVGFKSDAFEFRRVSELPLLDDLINKKDWALSNKVVAFNVDVGIVNQNIFKNISVGQEAGKETIESVLATDRSIKKYSGGDFTSQNISLWDMYSKRSYTCTVNSLGNAMIQPEMYFNLKHVPMFTGPYLITEVSHKISPGVFNTDFKGVRQQMFSYPEIKNYLQAMYKQLYLSLKQKLERKEVKTTETNTASTTYVEYQISWDQNVDTSSKCSSSLNKKYSNFIQSNDEQHYIGSQDLANLIISTNSGTDDNSKKIRVMSFITMYLYSFNSSGTIPFGCFQHNLCGAELTLDWGVNPSKLLSNSYICMIPSNQKNSIPYATFGTFKKMVEFTSLRWKNFVNEIDLNNNETFLKNWFLNWNKDPQPSANFDTFKNNNKSLYDQLLKKVNDGVSLAKTLKIY